MSDHPASSHPAPAGAHVDDAHEAGHDDHHGLARLGPIDWRMWLVGLVGVAAAVVVVAAMVVATDFVFLAGAG